MLSLTTLDLRREDLQKISNSAKTVDEIPVSHRGKYLFSITYNQPDNDTVVPGSKEAMAKFISEARLVREEILRRGHRLDHSKSIKELYHEMLDNDPKYNPSLRK